VLHFEEQRISSNYDIYLRQGGYVFIDLCLFVCLSVCLLLAELHKNHSTNVHKIRWKGGTRSRGNEGSVRFWR